jgi:hypothetical protein
MYYLRGEDIHDFREDPLDKLIDLWISNAKYVLVGTPVVAYLIGAASTAEFRITGECSEHVAWHVYLWYNGDMAFGSIADNLPGLLLGVKSAVGDAVIEVGIGAEDGA